MGLLPVNASRKRLIKAYRPVRTLRSAMRFSSRTIRWTVAVFPVPGTPDTSEDANIYQTRSHVIREIETNIRNLHSLPLTDLQPISEYVKIPRRDKVKHPAVLQRVRLASLAAMDRLVVYRYPLS